MALLTPECAEYSSVGSAPDVLPPKPGAAQSLRLRALPMDDERGGVTVFCTVHETYYATSSTSIKRTHPTHTRYRLILTTRSLLISAVQRHHAVTLGGARPRAQSWHEGRLPTARWRARRFTPSDSERNPLLDPMLTTPKYGLENSPRAPFEHQTADELGLDESQQRRNRNTAGRRMAQHATRAAASCPGKPEGSGALGNAVKYCVRPLGKEGHEYERNQTGDEGEKERERRGGSEKSTNTRIEEQKRETRTRARGIQEREREHERERRGM
ncbi:hypothetical protein NDU88_001645 [Pleurodeles waltl]|uniref:Uncharacterized protein n=1 Tax=Pleurodeles waltl TaxID=8319 RepID=A0AAV7T048_PLEWA|nr:hypothetical protein NDU88_001645 [Pleurodeles waltl]